MGFTVVCALLLSATAAGSTIPSQDIQHQNQVFRRYWGTELEWRFDALPESGSVPPHQIPYSGYIYPDNYGGTIQAMRKYDRAFHRGRTPAADWEDQDNERWKAPVERRGLFRAIRGPRMEVPSWSGHCNGWAAAAIRHAEPQQTVRYRDVVFTPSDIKGLLAELYIFNDVVDLSGSGGNISAGIFHVVLANWLGRGRHALGMEADPGEEKWNYPVYAFNSDSARISNNLVQVRLNLAYIRDTSREYDKAPKNYDVKHFHYVLNLDHSGRIIGGRFLRGSSLIAMLWLPLQPKQAGQPGNRAGNPHISARRILAIWRASVPAEERQRWVVVDPPDEDRYVSVDHSPKLMPVGYTVRPSASPESPQVSRATEEEDVDHDAGRDASPESPQVSRATEEEDVDHNAGRDASPESPQVSRTAEEEDVDHNAGRDASPGFVAQWRDMEAELHAFLQENSPEETPTTISRAAPWHDRGEAVHRGFATDISNVSESPWQTHQAP